MSATTITTVDHTGMPTPNGTGAYIRSIKESIHGTPEQAAKKAADHHMSFVVIMACWQDIQEGKFRQLDTNRRGDQIKRYSEAFLAKGVQPWIWGYPWAGHYIEFLESMREAHVDGVTAGWFNDGELGCKWRNQAQPRGRTMRGQPEAFSGTSAAGTKGLRIQQADEMMIKTRNEYLPAGCGHVTTSYGIARHHKNFPWKQMLMFGGISPQLYKESLRQIDKGIDEWLAHWEQSTGLDPSEARILPSVAAYGEKAQLNMRRYLASFLLSKHPIDGVCVWSWRQIDRHEWNELARFADDVAEGATRVAA
jgi:hypothetical protein